MLINRKLFKDFKNDNKLLVGEVVIKGIFSDSNIKFL